MNTTPIISMSHLTKKFKDVVAVNDISFDVPQGSMCAFLGPNGAGKTTTIKMLTTLLKPDGGTLMVNGFDPVHDSHAVRHSFGIVFQDPSLDDELTAYENLFRWHETTPRNRSGTLAHAGDFIPGRTDDRT